MHNSLVDIGVELISPLSVSGHQTLTLNTHGLGHDDDDAVALGGGDGGTGREILKHPSVKKVDMVESLKSVE